MNPSVRNILKQISGVAHSATLTFKEFHNAPVIPISSRCILKQNVEETEYRQI